MKTYIIYISPPMNGINQNDVPEIAPSYRKILLLAFPLVLSMSGLMLMQFFDALFLSWYSIEAIAAVVPAGMLSWTLISLFHGTAMYTSVFVSQYIGAKQPHKVGGVVWQGIYFALFAGVIIALFSFLGEPIFNLAGHAHSIRTMEVQYFSILCLGGGFSVMVGTLSGFFSGQGETRTLMVVRIIGFGINAIGDYLLIFGKCGMPRLGIVGAGIATVCAEMVVCIVFAVLFLRKKYRVVFAVWAGRRFDIRTIMRLMKFGFPNGSRFTIEMIAWTMFLFFIGRLGEIPLASTNIAWRINSIAFLPIIGLSQAVGILVGQAQGAKRSDISIILTSKGLIIAEIWMIGIALLFVLFPRTFYGLFYNPDAMSPQYFQQLAAAGVILLRFVALYSLLDGFNIIILGTLQAAGDTAWTLITSITLHLIFLAALIIADFKGAGLAEEWAVATGFVMSQALVWFWRYKTGKWREIEVIDDKNDAGAAGFV